METYLKAFVIGCVVCLLMFIAILAIEQLIFFFMKFKWGKSATSTPAATVHPSGGPSQPAEPMPERHSLYWFLVFMGLLIPWLFIACGFLWGPESEYIDDKMWLLIFIFWPIAFFKKTWTTMKPDELGALYGFNGIPLVNNITSSGREYQGLNPLIMLLSKFTTSQGIYFTLAGIIYIDKDSNSNRAYTITAMTDVQLRQELGIKTDDPMLTEEELTKKRIFRFNVVSTATKEIAEKIYEARKKKGLNPADFEDDDNNRQIATTPSVFINVIIEDYFYYLKNVKGKNAEEREIEVGRQLLQISKSLTNREYKKNTFAMILFLQHTKRLDVSLQKEVYKLLNGYGHDDEGSLGLKAIYASYTSPGASEKIHNAINSVLEAVYTAQAEEQKGLGEQKGNEKRAIGLAALEKLTGVAKAEVLEELFKKAKQQGVDPTVLAVIQANLELARSSKQTFITTTDILNLISSKIGGKP